LEKTDSARGVDAQQRAPLQHPAERGAGFLRDPVPVYQRGGIANTQQELDTMLKALESFAQGKISNH